MKWNDDRSSITVSQNSLNGASLKNVILCDIQGRVFFSKENLGPDSSVSIDVSGLNKGTYVLYVGTDEEPLSYRFML